MAQEAKTHIKVYVTKSNVFRARIVEAFKKTGDKRIFEVSIGGESWMTGKGRKYQADLRLRAAGILLSLVTDYVSFLNSYKVNELSGIKKVVFDLRKNKILIGGTDD